jgi:hypothetical protein
VIHEFATRDLGRARGITATLGITGDQQVRLSRSANNLSPIDGGRHIGEGEKQPWTFDQQNEFAADLLRRWILHLARS